MTRRGTIAVEIPIMPVPPVASICSTCVTPGYCTKNNTCAQGNKLTDEVDDGAELCAAP